MLNNSNRSHTCIVPLTLSMLDISSVPINPVHVSITQILTGFLANKLCIIKFHLFLKSKKTNSVSTFYFENRTRKQNVCSDHLFLNNEGNDHIATVSAKYSFSCKGVEGLHSLAFCCMTTMLTTKRIAF